MKKRKIIALTLLVAFLCSLCIPGTWAIAGNEDNPTVPENEGMKISKTATDNEDGTYTITLEAYATGEKISTEVTQDVPTDIILVLDQSGSMDKNMNTYDFRPYTNKSNSDYYNLRHNGGGSNLYYQLEDGGYATVAVERSQTASGSVYKECPEWWPNNALWGTDNYFSNQYNLFVKMGDDYQKVELKRTSISLGVYSYTYMFPDGSIITSEGGENSPGNFNGKGPLYVKSNAQEYSYTYTYTDKDGVNQVIGTSEGNDTRPTDFALYERYSTGRVTRLQALKNAVNNFALQVSKKAIGKDGKIGTQDDVNHRIAVVEFTDNATNLTNGLVNMDSSDGVNRVKNIVDGLNANGNTNPASGVDVANNILRDNPVQTGQTRNRVIVLFTDGYPAGAGTDNINYSWCDSAIESAYVSKNTYGATVYTVGIFEGADPNSDIESNYQRGSTNSARMLVAANRYMQYTSTNYLHAQNMESGDFKSGDGYYLSASDADTLNNIFQQISDNIESAGSGTTLDENAVIKDVISPQFQLPAGATAKDITLETYSYTGEGQWSKNNDAMGATAAVNGDQVNVTGFDFAENWCGTETQNGTTTYRGNKLVISFPVKAKDGFLGGNGVYTNTSAGVYENAGAENPLFIFNRPQVDVPIKDITVEAEDKNVYLTGSLTEDQLKAGTVLKFGDKEIDLSKADDIEKPYGLEPWQTEYVTIAMGNVKDKGGNVISENLNNLTEDQKYTVTVDITPTTEGEETAKSCSGDGNISVFKPVLTFKDAEVYYGADVPGDNTLNESFVSGATVWKHGETLSTDNGVTMIGTAPTLTMTYTPDSTKTKDGKINSKTVDIPVDVANVKIGNVDVTNHTTFQHIDCDGKTCTVPTGKEFLLHPKTCTLTITKQGGDSNEPYVFDIMKNGQKYSEVTIVGNHSETIVELPVGIYTIREATGWSWRYNPAYSNNVVLSKDHASGTLTCTNQIKETKWLNGYSIIVKNIFGVSHNN